MENNEYDIDALNRTLLPPPRIQPFVENWPVIEPPFRDQRPPYEQEAEEWELVESNPIPDHELSVLTDDVLARTQEIVLNNEQIQKHLAKKRYVAIGASLRESKDRDSRPIILFVLYNYDDHQTIEVSLDHRSLEVTDVVNATYQPAPIQEEIDRAIGLARQHERLSARLTDDLIGTAILVTVDDPGDPRHNHRLFDIRFGCADVRLPRYSALVDLDTETVIHTGNLDGLCGEDEHE